MSNPKLSDIAAAAGVHVMTASRALRRVGRMRAETRQRVVDAASRLGYRPDASAAAMRTGHTGCLLWISTRPDALNQRALMAASRHLASAGGYLACACCADGIGEPPAILRRRLVEGVLLDGEPRASSTGSAGVPPAPQERKPDWDASLVATGLPVVRIGDRHPTNAVYADSQTAGRRVTQHLLEAGHRRMLCLCPPAHAAAQAFVLGHAAAMRGAGLGAACDVGAAFPSIAVRLAAADARPTVVLAWGSGLETLHALWQAGLRVPEEISLVAVGEAARGDGVIDAAPLPDAEIGRQAVDLLLRLLIDDGERPSVAVPFGDLAPGRTLRRM